MRKHRLILSLIAALLPPTAFSQTKSDSIFVSSLYTTHIIFSGEITYADLSSQNDVVAKIVETSKNKLAIKAKNPFTGSVNVSVEEANGTFHTYIVRYTEHPEYLVVDLRPGAVQEELSKTDTISLTSLYTSHFIFSTDIIYADISAPKAIAAKIVENGKNKLALKAREDFGPNTCSIAVEEANGCFHTYIVRYDQQPKELIFDLRNNNLSDAERHVVATARNRGSLISDSNEKRANSNEIRRRGSSTELFRRSDAPRLSEIMEMPQTLYHIYTQSFRIGLSVEGVYSYSDITYLSLRLDNRSHISYESSDAVFMIEAANGSKRKVFYETAMLPKSKAGTLTAPAGGSSKVAYTFDKMTLSEDQVLKIYLYENGGQRNLVLTLSSKDINSALSPDIKD